MPENISAFHLLLTGDPALFAVVWLSLIVSLSATFVCGADWCAARRVDRTHAISRAGPSDVMLNAFMGLPPVVVGHERFL